MGGWLGTCKEYNWKTTNKESRKILVGKFLRMGTKCEDKLEALVNAPQRAISEDARRAKCKNVGRVFGTLPFACFSQGESQEFL